MATSSALLGISLSELGRYAEARPHLEEALRRNPKDNDAEKFLANDLIKLGDLESAAARLKQIADRQPQDQEVWYLLGEVYMQLSQQALTKMNAINPDSELVHEMSGEIMESMKNYDGALFEYKKAAEVDKALAICPNLIQARVDRGRALLKLNRNEEAVKDLQAATQASPDDPGAHFFLAQAYRGLGRTGEAQAEMQIYSKLEESSRAATAARARELIQNKEAPH